MSEPTLIAMRLEATANGPGITWLQGRVIDAHDGPGQELATRFMSSHARESRGAIERLYGRVRPVREGFLLDLTLPAQDELGRPLAVSLLVTGYPGRDSGIAATVGGLLRRAGFEIDNDYIANALVNAGEEARVKQRNLLGIRRRQSRPDTPQPAPRLEPVAPPGRAADEVASAPGPVLKRRLLALRAAEYDRLRYSDGGVLLYDDFTTVVSLPLKPPWTDSPELVALDRQGRLKPGVVFVRNTLEDNSYVEVDEAYERFALSKYRAIALVCHDLGASLLETEELTVEEASSGTTTTINLKAPQVGSGRVNLQSESLNRLSSEMRQRLEWHEPTLPNIEEATRRAVESGLGGDPVIQMLIGLRRSGNFGRYEHEIDLSSEAFKEINFAAEIGPLLSRVPGLEIGTRITHLSKEVRRVRVKLAVEFPRR